MALDYLRRHRHSANRKLLLCTHHSISIHRSLTSLFMALLCISIFSLLTTRSFHVSMTMTMTMTSRSVGSLNTHNSDTPCVSERVGLGHSLFGICSFGRRKNLSKYAVQLPNHVELNGMAKEESLTLKSVGGARTWMVQSSSHVLNVHTDEEQDVLLLEHEIGFLALYFTQPFSVKTFENFCSQSNTPTKCSHILPRRITSS